MWIYWNPSGLIKCANLRGEAQTYSNVHILQKTASTDMSEYRKISKTDGKFYVFPVESIGAQVSLLTEDELHKLLGEPVGPFLTENGGWAIRSLT